VFLNVRAPANIQKISVFGNITFIGFLFFSYLFFVELQRIKAFFSGVVSK